MIWHSKVLDETNGKLSDPSNKHQIDAYVGAYNAEYADDNTYITGIIMYAKADDNLDIQAIEDGSIPMIYRGTKYGETRVKIIDLVQEFSAITRKLDAIFEEYDM